MPNSPAVTWLGHASTLIELDGVRLLTDPVLGGRVGHLVRVVPEIAVADLGRIDGVLLSHLHADHTNLTTLRRLGSSARLIAPHGAAAWLRRRGFVHVQELRAGDRLTVGELQVLATPAVHVGRRWPAGPRAEAIGYLVAGSSGVYFAGDTDLFDAMAELRGRVDVALLPVAGWGPTLGPGHLDPRRAAEAAALIEPRVAVPIHWGTLTVGWPGRPGRRAGDRARPAREFAAFARELAPRVRVEVLAVGERASVGRPA